MLARLEQQGHLYQVEVVREIAAPFGEEFTFVTFDGRLAIDGRVRRGFKAITRDSVVWERQRFCWRWREAGDLPGRNQE
jgi:hypothetical protein